MFPIYIGEAFLLAFISVLQWKRPSIPRLRKCLSGFLAVIDYQCVINLDLKFRIDGAIKFLEKRHRIKALTQNAVKNIWSVTSMVG